MEEWGWRREGKEVNKELDKQGTENNTCSCMTATTVRYAKERYIL